MAQRFLILEDGSAIQESVLALAQPPLAKLSLIQVCWVIKKLSRIRFTIIN